MIDSTGRLNAPRLFEIEKIFGSNKTTPFMTIKLVSRIESFFQKLVFKLLTLDCHGDSTSITFVA